MCFGKPSDEARAIESELDVNPKFRIRKHYFEDLATRANEKCGKGNYEDRNDNLSPSFRIRSKLI